MANLPIRRCLRCGQSTHTEENWPNFVEARTDHPDAWDHYENAPALEEDDGDNCILQNGNVIRQPGDGNCLFHTLSVGLYFSTSSPQDLHYEMNFRNGYVTIEQKWIIQANPSNIGFIGILVNQ